MNSYVYDVVVHGTGNTVILNVTMEQMAGNLVSDAFAEYLTAKRVTFVNIYVKDWNNDLSPWELGDSDYNKKFGGNANNLFDWMTTFVKEEIEPMLKIKDARYIVGGYSLAGLYSLWCALNAEWIYGCMSASGSLWYPGLTEYVETITSAADKIFYFSLGNKEEKTRDKYMSAVGDNTIRIYEHLQQRDKIKDIIFEWNPGNHFAEVDNRIIKGYKWILEHI